MILDLFYEQLKVDNTINLLSAIPNCHNEIMLITLKTINNIDLYQYTVQIYGMEGHIEFWDISLLHYEYIPNEWMMLIGFCRNGDCVGSSLDFPTSGVTFVREVLPKLLAHQYRAFKNMGRNITILSVGIEGTNTDRIKRKQRVYQSLFSICEQDNTSELVQANEMIKRKAGKNISMPILSFRLPNNFAIV